MPDVIQLLPDNIANQIAAGEVIQRPASAVKELLENAVDSGATTIKLIVADAGKSMIQVTDNGKGMSETDARMAFERHATSKIRSIDDLFRIRTMGFRGEALASIAAVAQVSLKTKRAEDNHGTCIDIENSVVIKQEPVAFPDGTQITMKNLFFNVPARRNFLKSNAAEMRHVVDEFIRVALSFPGIFFSLHAGNAQVFHLEKGSLKQRIVQILGNSYSSRLVSVQEKTDYLNIYGFVGKPDTAKRTRGDQYLFVNNRYIRSAYLNHAIQTAYQDMLPAETYPMYVLFIDLDPAQLDINVHPTKQEIKFEDEKIVYAFVQAAVKHALAQFSITPALDFELDAGIQQLDAVSKPITDEHRSAVVSSSLYQTFTQKNQAHAIEPSSRSEITHWKDLHDNVLARTQESDVANNYHSETAPLLYSPVLPGDTMLVQFHNTYILAPTARGIMLIHQQAAHERILYERFGEAMRSAAIPSQASMFPSVIELSTQDAVLLNELLPDLHQLGYLVEPFGKDSFVIRGVPADVKFGNDAAVIENLLEQFKHFSSDMKFSRREKLIRSLARQHAIKPGVSLNEIEMKKLVHALFSCSQPNIAPNGNPSYIEFGNDYFEKLFGR